MIKQIIKYFYLFFLLHLPVVVWGFENFDCVGSEPFWKLTLTEHQFTFKLNGSTMTMPAVLPKPSENMKIEHIHVYRTKMNDENVIIIIQKQSCTDGNSEDIFPYEGLFISKEKVFHGCCSKKLILTY